MAKPSIPIKILDILKQENILIDLKAQIKLDALKEMTAQALNKEEPSVKDEIVQALLDRERLGSTGIGSGVAVPHAKSPRVGQIICALSMSKKGIDFQALDQAPVYIVFLLVAPPNSQSEHLNILARIVRLLKDRVFRQALREAKTKEEVVKLIGAEDV
ncbi:MAG: PTS sugar transporter subunit IIA [Elusimicrobia bacterium]|nr:PTS sugar transporter subunit IIA [Elusimicrobiota bacterium]